MKKHLFSILAVAALVMGLTSCSKDDPATAVNVKTDATATIKGYVTYSPDLTATPAIAYPASADVKVVATVTYTSLTGLPASGSLSIAATYDAATGMYSVAVPATTNTANVTITFSGFSGKQKQSATSTLTGYWTPAPATFNQSVVAGQVLVGPTVAYSFAAAPVQ